MKRFRFNWSSSDWDAFVVEAEDDTNLTAKFKEQWAAWMLELKASIHSTRKDSEYPTPEEQRKFKHSITELGDPAIKFNPRPVCCEKINDVGDYAIYKGPPVQLRSHDWDRETMLEFLSPHWVIREIGITIEFCPFCGDKLPEVELMDNPAQPLWTGDPDGGYCDTCTERNMCCECNPPWTAYKIKN
jgi:hypothetical protein